MASNMSAAEWAASSCEASRLTFLVGDRGSGPHRARLVSRRLKLFASAVWRRLFQDDDEMPDTVATAEYVESVVDCNVISTPPPLSDNAWLREEDGKTAAWLAVESAKEHDVDVNDLLLDVAGDPFRIVRWVRTQLQPDGRCGCNCASPCPLGKVGSTTRCTVDELQSAGASWAHDWLTPQVLSLAESAYKDRDRATGGLDNLILLAVADALEEAGYPGVETLPCEFCYGQGFISYAEKTPSPFGDEDDDKLYVYPPPRGPVGCTWCSQTGRRAQESPVTAHLRSPSMHVRGCWALDLVLGAAW